MRVTRESDPADLRRKYKPLTRAVPEFDFQSAVMEAAGMLGWRVFHDTDSRRNRAGFPDLVLLRERLVVAELKRHNGVPTAEQTEWLLALARAGVETYVWRPRDWPEIREVLKR